MWNENQKKKYIRKWNNKASIKSKECKGYYRECKCEEQQIRRSNRIREMKGKGIKIEMGNQTWIEERHEKKIKHIKINITAK